MKPVINAAPVVDCHAHIAHFPTLKETKRFILESQEKYGVDYSLVSDCDASEYPSITKYGLHKTTMFQSLKRVIGFSKAHPQRIGALFWINPHNEKLTPELLSYIDRNDRWIHGMKIHPWESHIKMTDKRILPFLDLAERKGWPVLVHTAMDRYSDIAYLAACAKKRPNLIFIAAHLNLLENDKDRSIAYMKDCPNLLADTAWVEMKHAKRIYKELGPGRIIFGTDNPVDGLDTLANPLYAEYFSNALRLPKKEYQSLMGRKAIELFKIKID